MRQPHAFTASWGMKMVISVASVEPTSRPTAVEAGTSEQYRPRLLCGAYSARNVAAPAYSPAAEKPCTMRSSNSSSGAPRPIAAYVGKQPIRNVAPDMRKMLTDSAHLRPFLSPKLPQNRAPSGRMTNDTANTANVLMSAAVGSSDEKNTAAMTVAKYEYDA